MSGCLVTHGNFLVFGNYVVARPWVPADVTRPTAIVKKVKTKKDCGHLTRGDDGLPSLITGEPSEAGQDGLKLRTNAIFSQLDFRPPYHRSRRPGL